VVGDETGIGSVSLAALAERLGGRAPALYKHVDAPKQLVWDVLIDFAAYQEGNPCMKIKGTAQVGTKLTVHMGASGGRSMAFKPTVLAATPDDGLRWLGEPGFGGIVDGEHFSILDRIASMIEGGPL
jgi:hypothetical protein